MPLRLCVYNVKWFDSWFNADNSLKTGGEIPDKVEALGRVLAAIDPDLLGIVEGPNTTHQGKSTVTCLEALAAHLNLRTSAAKMGYVSRGSQELAVLYDSAKLDVVHDPGGSPGTQSNPRFDEEFRYDSDQDRVKEVYEHYRPPFEMKVTRSDNGSSFNIILAHLKSKGIFSKNDYIHWQRESQRTRRKLFAEANHVRLRVNEWLDEGRDVVVMGDINDGPGMDAHEFQFGRSAVEQIIGDLFDPGRILWAHCGKPNWGSYGWEPSSARFRDPFTEDIVNVLIDHILASSELAVAGANAHRIWNPYQLDAAAPLKDDLLKVSDHFPVSLDVV